MTTFRATVALVAAIALTGCGGGSIRYQPQAFEYSKAPLKIDATVKTYDVVVDGDAAGFNPNQVEIRGLARNNVTPDLVVHVAIAKSGLKDVQSGDRAFYVHPPLVGRDGKQLDGTRSNDYEKLGYHEPIAAGPVSLFHLRCRQGNLIVPVALKIAAGDRVVEEAAIGQQIPIAVGVPGRDLDQLQNSDSIEMVGFSGTNTDAAANTANDLNRKYIADVDTLGSGIYPRRELSAAAKQLNRDALKRLDVAWTAAVDQQAMNAGTRITAALNARLEGDYASGPRTTSLAFAVVEPDADFATALGAFTAVVGKDVAKRTSAAADADAALQRVVARGDAPVRTKAIVTYDRGLIAFCTGDVAQAATLLAQASTTNAQDKDSVFGSSGTDLAAKIDSVAALAKDLAARAKR